jgi:hypothetical protein
LDKVLKSDPPWWDWTAKSRAVAAILVAMQYIHSKGIPHSILTPAHILMKGPEHNVVVWNFDVDQPPSSQEKLYRDPEMRCGCERGQSAQHPNLTMQSDVVSFGVIFLHIIAGQQVDPMNLTAPEFASLIPCEIPQLIIGFISRCCYGKPEDRPSFDDIVNGLRNREFRIHPNSDKIEAYIEGAERPNAPGAETSRSPPGN